MRFRGKLYEALLAAKVPEQQALEAVDEMAEPTLLEEVRDFRRAVAGLKYMLVAANALVLVLLVLTS